MRSVIRRAVLSALIVASFGLCASAAEAPAARFDAGVISGLGARNIGSATMSGRIAAVAAVPGKDGKTTLMSARRPAACGNRPTVERRSRPCSTSSPCSRSARSRSILPITTRSGSAPANRGRAIRSRSATESTNPPTAARPGPTWVSEFRAHRQDPRRSPRRQHGLCLRAGQTVERFGRSRPLQDQRRRQDLDAGAQGREPFDRLLVDQP